MDTANKPSGFDARVWDQLSQISQNSQNSSARGGAPRLVTQRNGGPHGFDHADAGNPAAFSHYQQHYPPSMDYNTFPSLGSAPPVGVNNYPNSSQQHAGPFAPSPSRGIPPIRHGRARDYQERARGGARGGTRGYATHDGRQQWAASSENPPATQPPPRSHYGRPSPQFHGAHHSNFTAPFDAGQHHRSMRHAIMRQGDYLDRVGRRAASTHALSQEEATSKEAFRQELERAARDILHAQYPNLNWNWDQVRLKCYGSLANGFALAGCDMDLLLCLPAYPHARADVRSRSDGPGDGAGGVPAAPILPASDSNGDDDEEQVFLDQVRHVLEKGYLDKEYGARLLTKTRVPILRICQTPSPALLHNLRQNCAAGEESLEKHVASADDLSESNLAAPTLDTVEDALSALSVADTQRPPASSRQNSSLEFTSDCGIQCDVNFTNFVALHNSHLLHTYQSFDPRVAELGTFVKIWAKARDINTPYRGTLSSYGYILMVLHYLTNIASPPVLPNLQYLAKVEDSWNPDRPIELFEGFDVRFVHQERELADIHKAMSATKNRETSGQLLRGFFQYYATHAGFHWTRDIVAIRQKGGVLSKQSKGWTEAKWAQAQNKQVRLRYLFCIEDPFETDHNIARTVGHHGIVTIRDEFRRAWSILERVGAGAGADVSLDELLAPVTERVDTLRQDQESRRLKAQQMKQELEAQEKLSLQRTSGERVSAHTDGMWGSFEPRPTQGRSSRKSNRRASGRKLTPTASDQEQSKLLSDRPRRRRRIEVEVDSDVEGEDPRPDDGQPSHVSPNSVRVAETTDLAATRLEPAVIATRSGFCQPGEVLWANGLDDQGDPKAWDMDTQEGRWLHWRDGLVRNGRYRGFANASMRELDQQCPFDARRPKPSSEYSNKTRLERLSEQRPPWPAKNTEGETWGSVEDSSHGDGHECDHRDTLEGPRHHQIRAILPDTSREYIVPGHERRGVSKFKDAGIGFGAEKVLVPKNRSSRRTTRRALGDNVTSGEDDMDHHGRKGISGPPKKPVFRDSSRGALEPPSPILQKTYPISAVQAASNDLSDMVKASKVASPIRLAPGQPSSSATHPSRLDRSDIVSTPSAPERLDADADSDLDPDFVRKQRLLFFDKARAMPAGDEMVNTQFFQNVDEMAILTAPMGDLPRPHGQPGTTSPDKVIIKPAPAEARVEFDPRQLQDLDVIAKGGNGCARAGAEFQIEGDYELGGGGVMAHRVSSSDEPTAPGTGVTGAVTRVEGGQGDEDGLLDELPRDYD